MWLLLSTTTTTTSPSSSANSRGASRSSVVLPLPGRPNSSKKLMDARGVGWNLRMCPQLSCVVQVRRQRGPGCVVVGLLEDTYLTPYTWQGRNIGWTRASCLCCPFPILTCASRENTDKLWNMVV